MKSHLTSTLALLMVSSAAIVSAAEAPTSLPVAPKEAALTARQVPPTVTVTGSPSVGDLINKADHDGDDDSEEFKSDVGSFLSKATSVVGDAFKPTGTGTVATSTRTGTGTSSTPTGQRSGAGKLEISGWGGGLGVGIGGTMAGLAGLVGVGVLVL